MTTPNQQQPFSREELETNIGRVLRWIMIVFFFVVTVFPFYWMVNLSFRPEQDIQTNPTKLAPSWDNIQSTVQPVGCWIRHGRDDAYTSDELATLLLEQDGTEAVMAEYGLSLLVIEPDILPTIYTLVAEADLTDAQRRDVIENSENVPEGFVLVEDIPEQESTQYIAVATEEITDEQQGYVTAFDRLPRSEPRTIVQANNAVKAAVVASSTEEELLDRTNKQQIPEACTNVFNKSSFTIVLVEQGFPPFIGNSLLLSLLTVSLTLLLAIPAAYAITRLNYKGRNAMSWGILMIYMFPAIVLAIPLFVVFTRTGLRDTLEGLVIIYMSGTLPVALYMLRSYFMTIPPELEEAALIDGCTEFETIWRITIPLAMPAIASVALYTFMIAWNEFLYAFLFLAADTSRWTLPLGLQRLDSQEVPVSALMAGSLIVSIPIIVIFFFFERFLTQGLTAGAVKG
ncbi:MAG: carbohydrate ABC transporter permease [Phototrophicaceae bacterium]